MVAEGLRRGPDFKVWLMAEIPSNIILADQFNEFVDGYSIGSNDLTMLILGCDRDNDTVSHIYDERNLAVRRAIRHLIETAHREGIDSVSVNPDMVKETKKMVAQLEQRILLDAVTGKGRQANQEELKW